METKKVLVLAMHNELESAYPPLNIAVGAAASGADVSLVFSRKGIDILAENYVPLPSKGLEYLSNALENFEVSWYTNYETAKIHVHIRGRLIFTRIHHLNLTQTKCRLNGY
jgi:peroxiredoxin family protein